MKQNITTLIQEFIDGKTNSFNYPMCPNDLSNMINNTVGEDIQMEVGDINGWDCGAYYTYIGEKIQYHISISGYYETDSTVYKVDDEGNEI